MQLPLRAFLKKSKKNGKRRINWNAESEKAFEDCKNSLSKSVINTFPSSDLPITIHTDTLSAAIGGSIEQFEDNTWNLAEINMNANQIFNIRPRTLRHILNNQTLSTCIGRTRIHHHH